MDSHTPNKLSIIVCVHNEEAVICAKIKDILEKDKNGSVQEIIIVDDNSSDDTFKLAEECSDGNDKISVIRNAYKEGKWGAIVTGFEHAHEDILCLTDADVSFEKNTIENALSLFSDHSVGAVTSNQKIVLVRDGKESRPSVGIYEEFRNSFRVMESRIDSTIAFHGQCMFFRKRCIELTADGRSADDLDIAIRIRRNGYRSIFCRDSYYIEKMEALTNKSSRRIFRRRAKAVAETLLKHKDLLFNARYGKFGLISFPIEFFMNIALPFFIIIFYVIVAMAILLLPVKYNFLILFLFMFSLFIKRRFIIFPWYQMIGVINCLCNKKAGFRRWAPSRRNII